MKEEVTMKIQETLKKTIENFLFEDYRNREAKSRRCPRKSILFFRVVTLRAFQDVLRVNPSYLFMLGMS
jgi:hypothetical protein